MTSTPETRSDLLLELLRIPGISTSAGEVETARFIYNWLGRLDWFKQRPDLLWLLPTPLEGDKRDLAAVAALVLAEKPTRRTIILTGHFDVVDSEVYGNLAHAAFDPDSLADLLRSEPLDPEARADLESDDYLFGRGSMDMKCGVAIEMELIRDFAANRSLFDVNLLLLLVPDEENLSAGMRGAAPWLKSLQESHGLDYLAAINTEPTEAGLPEAVSPALFLGTVGKLMPVFLCVGRESHIGAYYDGFSAALLASHILALAEGNPALADPVNGECCPSWTCLEQKILRENYSVTVPGEAALYFNCYLLNNTPAQVLAQMLTIAEKAAAAAIAQLEESYAGLVELGLNPGQNKKWSVRVASFSQICENAKTRLGEIKFVAAVGEYLARRGPDPREAALGLMRELTRLSEVEAPLIVCGFLPPYYPPRSNTGQTKKEQALAAAAENVIAQGQRQFGLAITKAPYFTGLCDLSYFGFQGEPADLESLKENLPGWGAVYSLPIQDLRALDIPVINFGPSGKDPHKKTERLKKKFSFEQFPLLLACLIRSIDQANS